MKISLSLIIISLLFCWSGCIASAIEIRLHIPVASKAKSTCHSVCSFFVKDSGGGGPSVQGYSLRGIIGFIGVGYSSSEIKQKEGAIFSANAIDFSLTLIDLITLGYGEVKDAGISDGTTKYKPDSSSGSTKFFNFNYDFEPIKVLVGFRNWLVHQKYEFFRFEQSLDYNEISIGVGYEF